MTKKDHQINVDSSVENKQVSRRRAIISLKSRAAMKRTRLEKWADQLADGFGSIWFFGLNAIWFLVWMFFNSGIIKNIAPFDPFPYSLLTMTVSLEAIFLSIIVLIAQNRAAKVDDLRQELDLQLNLIAEEEITKIMEMLARIMTREHLDVSKDKVFAQMLKPLNAKKIEEELEKQM